MRDKDFKLSGIAKEISELSTCGVIKVGCIITRNGRIISSGYNGSFIGAKHCNRIKFKSRDQHHLWSKENEVHAEANAILYAARYGISINETVMYCTHSPCFECAKMIIQSGIKKLFFIETYDRGIGVVSYLMSNGVEVECVDNN